MKAAARLGAQDGDDFLFFIRCLSREEAESVFAVIEKRCPRRLVPARTRFFVKELFEQRR